MLSTNLTDKYLKKYYGSRAFIVNAEKGLAFAFIPRNASSSIKVALEPYEWVGGYHKVSKEKIDRCIVFTAIKNPITRFVSGYCEILRLRPDIPEASRIALNLSFWYEPTEEEKISKFIEEIGEVGLFEGHLLPQSFWMNLGCQIDEYLVCEHLEYDVVSFSGKYFLDLELPEERVNPGNRPKLRKRLSKFLAGEPRLLGMVRDLYVNDFKLYEEKTGITPEEYYVSSKVA
jgi:hypothetical protein